jgi:hypothetical protein
MDEPAISETPQPEPKRVQLSDAALGVAGADALDDADPLAQ